MQTSYSRLVETSENTSSSRLFVPSTRHQQRAAPDWEGCLLTRPRPPRSPAPRAQCRGTLPWSGLQMSRLPSCQQTGRLMGMNPAKSLQSSEKTQLGFPAGQW